MNHRSHVLLHARLKAIELIDTDNVKHFRGADVAQRGCELLPLRAKFWVAPEPKALDIFENVFPLVRRFYPVQEELASGGYLSRTSRRRRSMINPHSPMAVLKSTSGFTMFTGLIIGKRCRKNDHINAYETVCDLHTDINKTKPP